MNNLSDKFLNWISLNQKLLISLFLLLSIIFPLFIDNTYLLGLGILFFINSILAISSNFITGIAGILSIGQAAFFGVGAYVGAILATKYKVEFIFGLIAGVFLSIFLGWLIGMTALRVKDKYLAMITLGFSEIFRIIALNWENITRGAKGITGIPGIILFGESNFSYLYKYYAALIVFILVILAVVFILNTKFGRGILYQKNDELAAAAVGVNTGFTKQVSFAISAGIAGAAGVLYAHYMNYIDPSVFSFDQSIFILSMAILGGLGSLPGSILGALILTILPEALRFSEDYRLIIYGSIIVFLVIFRPSGILGRVDFSQIKNKLMSRGENNE